MLKNVDEGLGLFMGLGLNLEDKEEGKRMGEQQNGLMGFNDKLTHGPDRGPVNRHGLWKAKPSCEIQGSKSPKGGMAQPKGSVAPIDTSMS